ncbi:hypothetical protein IFM61606_00577 [Aspergillus udagawae]|uniref:Fumarylacetoacetase n=1 Tax=Aspergillus udagawae TaxID=91492 RepID=A0ABQ1AJE0_9EURO|nr:hypothetical protein IFM53868_03085 [Aspergillus udagawae]GFG02330.1 hypothetical protein IFM5058_00886 [Aspergillus udagawae]GFG20481.1 hypothetical protein IFM61606_00577 [Aspergillus udagawae]
MANLGVFELSRNFHVFKLMVVALENIFSYNINTERLHHDYSSINNLSFRVTLSSQHPQPQCATRLNNTIIFLGDSCHCTTVPTQDADEHIFRPVIPNNWSASETTISPLIITVDALAEPRISLPKRLQDIVDFNYAVSMKGELEHGASTTLLSESHARYLFWRCRQMGVHLASTGCDLRAGDMHGDGKWFHGGELCHAGRKGAFGVLG